MRSRRLSLARQAQVSAQPSDDLGGYPYVVFRPLRDSTDYSLWGYKTHKKLKRKLLVGRLKRILVVGKNELNYVVSGGKPARWTLVIGSRRHVDPGKLLLLFRDASARGTRRGGESGAEACTDQCRLPRFFTPSLTSMPAET